MYKYRKQSSERLNGEGECGHFHFNNEETGPDKGGDMLKAKCKQGRKQNLKPNLGAPPL